ncbi:MAG TPA: DUF882 domain-containing protein [Burkholderiaceae bacterium]|jgi:uncharacterized protein YcbK (DUF882 family)|nr:DUF882 domain-containing protein [Burkholderiaceae bacterium]
MNAPTRRLLLRHVARVGALAAATALPLVARSARAAAWRGERALSLVHTHTRERLALTYAADGEYLPDALERMNRFLRDHYTGEVGRIDPPLLDLLHGVQQRLGQGGAFEIISGYRCPATNQRLRREGGGGVATRSLHMDGRAVDVRLPGVPLDELRDAALDLRAGGVGFYARERFVHVDTGRVRRW